MAMETLMHNKSQQLSSISVMLDYDIDNALNTIKENCHLINSMSSYFPLSTPSSPSIKDTDSQAASLTSEINNNAAGATASDESDHSEGHPKTNAKRRWKILAKVLRKDSEESVPDEAEDAMASVRRFKSFDVLQQGAIADDTQSKMIGKPDNWYTYRIRLGPTEYSVNIHHMDRQLTPADLIGFNNTGNICVWPSEEALTVYCLKEIANFDNKWILELGGGMTCLSGLMIAKYAKPYAVHLTDGNQISVENVRRTIRLNELSCYTKCSILKWENANKRLGSEHEKFDFILSADCLFFDEARSALVDTIWYYLSKTGVALVMAPRRGRTLSDFVEQCRQHQFDCQIEQRYSEVIWARHVELQSSDMADYWKSNDRKYCDFCKCWITDNKPSIAFHENGRRHKANVAKRISEIGRNSAKAEKEQQKFDQELRKMEDAALRSYAKDVSCKADLTAKSINAVMSAGTVASTSTKQYGPQVDPLMPPADFDPEREGDSKRVGIKSVKPEVEGSMWVEAKSPDGYTYYWNVKNNETVWVPPKEGFMPLDEYNRINEIAVAQQQLQLKEDSKSFQLQADEVVARYRREQLKRFRRPDPEEVKKEAEERASFKTEEEAQAPVIGAWQVVETKKEEPAVDLELPERPPEYYYVPPVVTETEPEPPVKKFKEKTIESLESDDVANVPTTFKKRKIPKGNTRQRLDVD